MAEDITQDLKKSFDEIKNLYEGEFKSAVLKGEQERKSVGDQLGLTKEKLDRMEAKFQSYDKLWEDHRKAQELEKAARERLEAQIAESGRASVGGAKSGPNCAPELSGFFSPDVKSWGRFMRKGEERMTLEETKGLAVSNDASGGYLVPVERYNSIVEIVKLISPLRSISNVVTISQGDSLEVPRESGAFTSGWVIEKESRTESTAGTFALERIPVNEMYANVYATQKLLDDAAFDVEGYISRKVADEFAQTEGAAFCTGTGVGQPEGVASTNGGVSTQVCTSSGAFTAPLLIDLQYVLPQKYQPNATWVTKRVNLGKIRQLTLSSYGDFIWVPGMAAGAPPTILGSPYITCEDVATIVSASAGAKVIYYGDFKAGYWIVDKVGISLLRDPYSSKPQVQFYFTKRVGGGVVLSEAFYVGTVNS